MRVSLTWSADRHATGARESGLSISIVPSQCRGERVGLPSTSASPGAKHGGQEDAQRAQDDRKTAKELSSKQGNSREFSQWIVLETTSTAYLSSLSELADDSDASYCDGKQSDRGSCGWESQHEDQARAKE